jgi:hypothetical protein
MTRHQETNLESILTNSHKDNWISYIASHPYDFPELIQLSLSDNQPYSWRASWLLWSCMNNNDQRIKKYIQEIIEILPDKPNGQQRALLKVLERMEIEANYEGPLFDVCSKVWQNINYNPSLRFQAFKMMVDISKKYPELKSEIILLTDSYYTDTITNGVKKSLMKLIANNFKNCVL